MKISKIGIVGAGQMGAGIAQVAATSGLSVVVTDVAQASLDKGQAAVTKSLGRLVKKEKIIFSKPESRIIKIQSKHFRQFHTHFSNVQYLKNHHFNSIKNLSI